MKEDMYIQCRFHRDGETTVAWVEERGAALGKWVELIGTGDGLWEVIDVYANTALTKDQMRKNENKHRQGFESIR